jgi:23S rRNA pseudouridine1911/1915/1917 synthase
MQSPAEQKHIVATEQSQKTLAALLRQWLPDQSWAQVRKLVDGQRVRINGELWLDSARRLKEGDEVEIASRPVPRPNLVDAIVIRHIDEHVAVVEKPSGINTVRHPAERAWHDERRMLMPTLEDLVARQLGLDPIRKKHQRLRVVQRLDKETSGLIVFARSVLAERILGSQFRKHEVIRRYLAVVPGRMQQPRTIRSSLVENRGDGRRGSTTLPKAGKAAITHIEVVETLPGYSILSCRLETGRTHQIRIHLAEAGYPLCGDKVYCRKQSGELTPDNSGAPRLALHAAELGFVHPLTGETVHWEMPLPPDLAEFVTRLRQHAGTLPTRSVSED